MDFTDFLKNVRDGANLVPVVGPYISSGIGHFVGDDESATGKAMDKYFLKPGSEPIVRAANAMTWAYDNGVSQPLSTAILMGSSGQEQSLGQLFSASSWAKAWHAANHISPGQAFAARAYSQTGALTGHDFGPASAKDLINGQPQYAAPAPAYLPPGWKDMDEDQQQQLLKQAGAPIVGNSTVEQLRRDHSFFTFSSGAGDFLARWYLDPSVLGGKALGAARAKYIVTPRPAGGWTGADIDSLMKSSRMAKVQDFLWKNRNQPDLVNNLDMFKKSALGPRAGGIISQLKSPEEVGLFLRTTLGDVEARAQLQDSNAAAASRMEQDTSRLSSLELGIMPRVQALNMPNLEAMVQRRTDVLRSRIASDEDLA